ncbi:hypothetical protein PIB30_063274 [Stylosanthes scabra]|uniref:Uncharacterized protein n=1 Tax=Stylosanthes scabra TaxID=79078 RepID=A0ABU6UMC7_9FABA|nr:hypothetical protein [Stylosanthes scabra]
MKRFRGTATKVSTTIVSSKSCFRIGLYPCEECFLSLFQILFFSTPRFKSALSKFLSEGEGKRPWFLSLHLVNGIVVEGFLLLTLSTRLENYGGDSGQDSSLRALAVRSATTFGAAFAESDPGVTMFGFKSVSSSKR